MGVAAPVINTDAKLPKAMQLLEPCEWDAALGMFKCPDFAIEGTLQLVRQGDTDLAVSVEDSRHLRALGLIEGQRQAGLDAVDQASAGGELGVVVTVVVGVACLVAGFLAGGVSVGFFGD